MIRIPLINKVLGIKPSNKQSSKITALSKEIGTMASDPKWIAFIEKERLKEQGEGGSKV